MEISVQVTGIDDLLAKLEKLDDEAIAAVLKPAFREGADVIRDDAKARCPVYAGPPRPDVVPGLGRDSIKTKVTVKKGSLSARVETAEGDFKGDTFYMSFLEFGHRIGKRLSGRGGEVKAANDLRTEVAPRPFLRPAFDHNKDRVLALIGARIREALDRLTK